MVVRAARDLQKLQVRRLPVKGEHYGDHPRGAGTLEAGIKVKRARPTRVLICPDTLLARQYHRGATIVRSPRAAGGPRARRRRIIAPVR
jgi:hypothetical protein